MSIPQGLFRAVERMRKARGESRSSVIREALRDWLNRHEIKVAESTAVRLLSNEDW